MLRLAAACAAQVRLPKARSLHSQAWGVATGEPDMSKPVEPDWKKLLAMTHSPEARRKIALLKADLKEAEERELKPFIPEDDPDPTNIDWEDWKKKVDPEMVEMFKNGLKRLKIPRIVPIYEDVDAMFEPILEDTKELMEYSAKRAAELELELAKVDYELANLKRLTMVEEWELNPDIAAEVDKEISEGKWF